ncbi:hypothetical protein DITRI_Ditri10aG0015400 [Diplodiscus trichospermus]
MEEKHTIKFVKLKGKPCQRLRTPLNKAEYGSIRLRHYTLAFLTILSNFESFRVRSAETRKSLKHFSYRFRALDFRSLPIRFILLQNRQGKTRLAKYYVPLEDSEKHKVEYEVHRLVVNRDPKFTNFVEFRTHKIIYRRYAGLFFSLCVDITDNELAYLECIHLFVEILDHFFSNVCELDLVFNFQKVYLILDEFILAGELQETSKKAIIERMGELEKLE